MSPSPGNSTLQLDPTDGEPEEQVVSEATLLDFAIEVPAHCVARHPEMARKFIHRHLTPSANQFH